MASVTEDFWLRATGPGHLVAHLAGCGARPRKLRLFGVAVCRSIWELLTHPSQRQAVWLAEQLADDRLSFADPSVRGMTVGGAPLYSPAISAARAVLDRHPLTAASQAPMHAANAARFRAGRKCSRFSAFRAERVRQAELLRCLFGNPFRPVVFDPAVRLWNGGAAVPLATEMYESRNFGKAPLLADMCEDAGVTDAQLLEHLRGPGPHARGCFAVDLLLGRG
jgi:hypothetical protein